MQLPPNTELLLTDWFRRVRESQKVHYECAAFFSRMNYVLGIPAVILSTLVGTAVFASFEEGANGEMRIVVGMLSIFAAVLASLQTFLGFSQRADKHRLAGSEYGAVRRALECIKTFPPQTEEELEKAVLDIKDQMDSIARSGPEVPRRIKHRVDLELKSREHRRVYHLVPESERVALQRQT